MANLTISVDDEMLKRARVRAVEMGTSVNALLAEHLARLADPLGAQVLVVRDLFALADRATKSDGRRAQRRAGRRWTRGELHER